MLTVLPLLCVAAAPLERAATHVAAFEVEEALTILERVAAEPPHSYDDHRRLYELLGISYAYVDRDEEAATAFDSLLMLDPGHAIEYTLSPKATFQFQRARERARERVPPALAVSWPRGLSVGQPISVVLEVVSDPRRFLKRAFVYHRAQGANAFARIDVDLLPVGHYQAVTLPAVAPVAAATVTVELYVVALDARGSEVLRVARAERPREIALAYEEPVPIHKRWWLWAAIGGVVATGVGTTLLLTRDPSAEVAGSVQWQP